jgi:phosphohistidine phosphatase SixA
MKKQLKHQRLYASVTILLLLMLNRVNLAQASEQEAWTALQQGKAVVLMRHAYAPDTNEVSPINPVKCADERNISAEGAQQAKNVAETLRANKIEKANVYSSSLCRCIDTGVLFEYGEVKNLPALNGYSHDRSLGPSQTEALRNWIKNTITQSNTPHVLVTHGLNISDLMESFAEQGEALIIGIENNKLIKLYQFSPSMN